MTFIPNKSLPEFLREVSLGRVPGHTPVAVSSRNLSVPGTEFEDIWIVGGQYPYPVAAATLTIQSTSPLDIAAGTGARSVTVIGLDANYEPLEETIALNGPSSVVTVGEFLRFTFARVEDAGASLSNLGAIDILHGASTLGRMAIGENKTQLSHYTIPAGKTGLLVFQQASSSGSIELDFLVRKFGSNKPFLPREVVISSDGATSSELYLSDPIAEKSDVKWVGKKIGLGTQDVSVEYRLLIIDNEVL